MSPTLPSADGVNRLIGQWLECVGEVRPGDVLSHELTRDPCCGTEVAAAAQPGNRLTMTDAAAAAVAALVAAQLMELPAYLQRALGLPVRQDIFGEAG